MHDDNSERKRREIKWRQSEVSLLADFLLLFICLLMTDRSTIRVLSELSVSLLITIRFSFYLRQEKYVV